MTPRVVLSLLAHVGEREGCTSADDCIPLGVGARLRGFFRGSVQGFTRYRSATGIAKLVAMPKFVLSHRHDASECAVAAASWKGFRSPLRNSRPLGSCATGGHWMWWTVEALDRRAALAQLPPYVATRTVADEVREVRIP